MQRSTLAATRLLVLSGTIVSSVLAADPADVELERKFNQTVKPFLATYCMACHGSATPAAGFDLKPYTTMQAVVGDFGHWTILMDKVASNSMPPKGLKQPAAGERKTIVEWIQSVRTSEARKHAGDP